MHYSKIINTNVNWNIWSHSSAEIRDRFAPLDTSYGRLAVFFIKKIICIIFGFNLVNLYVRSNLWVIRKLPTDHTS